VLTAAAAAGAAVQAGEPEPVLLLPLRAAHGSAVAQPKVGGVVALSKLQEGQLCWDPALVAAHSSAAWRGAGEEGTPSSRVLRVAGNALIHADRHTVSKEVQWKVGKMFFFLLCSGLMSVSEV
jgi:hypothetical protein